MGCAHELSFWPERLRVNGVCHEVVPCRIIKEFIIRIASPVPDGQGDLEFVMACVKLTEISTHGLAASTISCRYMDGK